MKIEIQARRKEMDGRRRGTEKQSVIIVTTVLFSGLSCS